MQKLMERIYSPDFSVVSTSQKPALLLSPEYWINRQVESAGPTTRHMRPFYAPVVVAGQGMS